MRRRTISDVVCFCFVNSQVETIGDAYMVVSGAPMKKTDHADRVCDMALDMVEAITNLKDRSTGTFFIAYRKVVR